MLSLKVVQVVKRIAKNALFLGLFNCDALVVCVDLQNVTRINVKVGANILGYNDTSGFVNFPKISINHKFTISTVFDCILPRIGWFVNNCH